MIDRDDCTKGGKEAATLTVQQQMLALAPNLRAFAMSICGSADKADDLVQETMLRAITRIDSFPPGTNLGAWLRDGFAADVAFNAAAALPGGAEEIAILHYAVDGLMLDRLTTSIDPGTPTDDVVDRLVAGLIRRS